MGIFGVSAAIASASAFLVRRRVSKNWIDYRSSHHDLTNKVIVITGGNTGLGFEAAKDFARRNARVVIACRNMEKGREAIKSIQDSTGNHNVDCMELDLASLASVKSFTDSIKSNPEISSIHALVCNAGVWIPPADDGAKDPSKYKTKDGFETHFGVNHLSHYLLAKGLTDTLNNSGDGRIVFVSSSLMKSGKVDFEKFDHIYEGRTKEEGQINSGEDGKKKPPSFAPPAYCDTKLMNALTCRHLSTNLPPSVTTYAVCPGFCRSSLGRHVSFPFYKKIMFAPIMLLIQRTSRQGAQNIIFATLEKKEKLRSGEFYRDGDIAVEQTEHVGSLGDIATKKMCEVSDHILKEFLKEAD